MFKMACNQQFIIITHVIIIDLNSQVTSWIYLTTDLDIPSFCEYQLIFLYKVLRSDQESSRVVPEVPSACFSELFWEFVSKANLACSFSSYRLSVTGRYDRCRLSVKGRYGRCRFSVTGHYV